jgi:hypothetical protein
MKDTLVAFLGSVLMLLFFTIHRFSSSNQSRGLEAHLNTARHSLLMGAQAFLAGLDLMYFLIQASTSSRVRLFAIAV